MPDLFSDSPRVWILLGDKAGDNAQIDPVVHAIGWPCERKHLHFKSRYARTRPGFRPTLHHVDLERSAPLSPPWPDLILTAGRRPASVALWVRRQSGNHTKLVIFGRPHRMFDAFDLVITSAQFALPERPNVMQIDLPLMRINQDRLTRSLDAWKATFDTWPRPLVAFLIGGPQAPFRLDGHTVKGLIRQIERTAPYGTLAILTSRRTPKNVMAALDAMEHPNIKLIRWTPESRANAHLENPYLALLGLSDRVIVSGDSISMMVETIRLQKPLTIASLPLSRVPWVRLERRLGRRFRAATTDGQGLWSRLKQTLHRNGIFPFVRDFEAFHTYLIKKGLAVRLGEDHPIAVAPQADNLSEVIDRIQALFSPATGSRDTSRR